MTAQIFPPKFPVELTIDAFLLGSEAAWPLESVAKAVHWFQKNGIAVLGTELWIVRAGTLCPGIVEQGIRGIFGNDVSRKPNEHWDDFVIRSADETLQYVDKLQLPPEAKEQGDVFINVVWITESDFMKLRIS